MVSFYGDYDTTETVVIPFNTFTSDDPSASSTITNLANTDIHIHKDGGTTQRSSASGVTVSIDFDTITGNHICTIDLSDNTDAGFYAAGSRYQVRMEGTTIDGATVNAWIGAFSIGCTLRPTTAGRTLDIQATGEADVNVTLVGGASTNVSALATNVDAIKTKTDFLPSATAGAAGGLFIAGTNAATTITSSSGSALTLSSTGGNGHGLAASGNGTGYGVSATGGVAGGHGIYAIGSTTGSGIYSIGGSLSAGIYGQGGANGAGIQARGGSTSGAGFYAVGQTNSPGINASGQGSGNGFSIIAGATGIGLSVTGGSTSGDGFYVSATSGDGIDAVSAGGGVDIRGDITGNVTGNLSGSVGSLTGHTVQTGDTYALANGSAGFVAIDTVVDSILAAIGTPIDFGSGTSTIAANLQDMADNGTATYDRSTDSLQAIRDHVGDGTNLTEAGGDGDHLSAIPKTGFKLASDGLDLVTAWTVDITGTISTVTTCTDLTSTAHSEPTGVPAANETIADKIGYLFMALRNRIDVTASKKTFYGDDGVAEWEKDLSDDTTTYSESEGNAI